MFFSFVTRSFVFILPSRWSGSRIPANQREERKTKVKSWHEGKDFHHERTDLWHGLKTRKNPDDRGSLSLVSGFFFLVFPWPCGIWSFVGTNKNLWGKLVRPVCTFGRRIVFQRFCFSFSPGRLHKKYLRPGGPDLYLCLKTILWRSRDRRLVSLPVVDSPKDEWFPQGTNDQVPLALHGFYTRACARENRKRVRQRKGRSHTDSRFKLWIHMRESQNFQHSLCLVSSVGM